MSERRSREVTIVPATPDWNVAILISGSENKETGEKQPSYFALDPIIAWQIVRDERPYHPDAQCSPGETCVTGDVTPITTEGLSCESNPWAIKRPDGKFEIPYDRTIENEAEAIEYFSSDLRTR
jgi:hypothetical protein